MGALGLLSSPARSLTHRTILPSPPFPIAPTSPLSSSALTFGPARRASSTEGFSSMFSPPLATRMVRPSEEKAAVVRGVGYCVSARMRFLR